MLFAADDRTDLMRAAARLAGDRRLARRLGGVGRAYAERCTWADSLDVLLARYRATINQRLRPQWCTKHPGAIPSRLRPRIGSSDQ